MEEKYGDVKILFNKKFKDNAKEYKVDILVENSLIIGEATTVLGSWNINKVEKLKEFGLVNPRLYFFVLEVNLDVEESPGIVQG